MNISETPINDEMLGNIRGCADDAAVWLGIDRTTLTAAQVVQRIDDCVHQWRQADRSDVDDDNDLSLTLGSLWGEQLAREFGWQWASVTFHDHNDSKAVGVFSPDRSLAIYPFHFIYGCMSNDAPVAIMLAFNMLKDGDALPELPAYGYENMMDGVQHAVPRA